MKFGMTGLGMGAAAAMMTLGMSGTARADVKVGVDAWQQGDYLKAIAEWRPLANAGDTDAQFNMGQAYKLGHGVPVDLPIALEWYRKAAAQGHTPAQDKYGLLLYQMGRMPEAMVALQKSADRGEPRAQYLVGTALFNGDTLPKDWVRAYALMTRASASGMPAAAKSLEQMDQYIPEPQRKLGLALATKMGQQNTQLASATTTAPITPRALPQPVRTTELPPSSSPGWNSAATSSSGPGTTYAPPPMSGGTPKPAPRPAPAASAAATAPKPAPRPAPVAVARSGNWRIQLGAFSEDSRARTLWSELTGKVAGLSSYQPYLVKGGNVTRLQAGPLGSQAEAEKLCRTVKAAGADCIPKGM